MLLMLIVMSLPACQEDGKAPELQVTSIEGLISRAGNTEDEKQRYQLLEELRERDDLDPALVPHLDTILPVVDRWANGREKYWVPGDKPLPAENGYLCDFFAYRVWLTLPDLVDEDSPFYPVWKCIRPFLELMIPVFPTPIEEDSPLYPVWCLYRGRMLIQQPIQHGMLKDSEDLRREYFDEGRRLLGISAQVFPENRLIRMYLDRAQPWPSVNPPDPNAPTWANLQRESLEKLSEIIHFWIDERQAPDGQFGGGWGDDVEMWRNWVPILIGFEDPKTNAAQELLSSGLFALPRMAGGYTNKMTDVEHTAEDSGDTGTAMMHIDPDNPIWQDRALRIAELMRDLWTGWNDRGLLQFKSTYFTSQEVDPSSQRACDTVYHPRAVQPALLYWQRTEDPELTSLFRAWLDTWVDAAASEERGKPAGILPSAIHWPDGQVGGLGENWWDPENHFESSLYRWPSAMKMLTNSLLLTSHLTGDDAYLEPIRTMAAIRTAYLEDPPEDPEPGSAMWSARRMGGILSETLGKYRLLTGDDQFDQLLLADANAYVRYRLTGDEQILIRALEETAGSFRINRAGYTDEVRWTDRVFRFHSNYANDYADPPLPKPGLNFLYSSITGDFGNPLYFPMNAVRWKTPPLNIAVLVTDHSTTHLSADLYHFGSNPRSMGAEFYLLDPGEYEWMLMSGSELFMEGQIHVNGPRALIDFVLPPRGLCTFRVNRLNR